MAALAVLSDRSAREGLNEKLSAPAILIGEVVEDLLAWGMVSEEVGVLRKTEASRRCTDIWWATTKRGYWEFEPDHNWLLGEGTFGFRGPLNHLADAGMDIETGVRCEPAMARQRIAEFRSDTQQLEGFLKGEPFIRSLLLYLIHAEVANSVSELSVIQTAFELACKRSQANRIHGLLVKVLSEISAGMPENQKTKARVRAIETHIDNFRTHAVRHSTRKREADMQITEEVCLAAWLSGRKGLLREVAESQPRALFARCDLGQSTEEEMRAGRRQTMNIEDSRFGESGLLGLESFDWTASNEPSDDFD